MKVGIPKEIKPAERRVAATPAGVKALTDQELTEKLLDKKVVGIAYETVQLEDGTLPLLAPMSEVAGALSIQMGAYCLEAKNGGKGILLSGLPGIKPARVTIIGGGVAGLAAAMVAEGIGARTYILDVNFSRLRYIREVMGGRVVTLKSNPASIEEECLVSDLVIGTVLVPGAKAPRLISRDLVRRMQPGSAIVDVSVDQGGCAETTRPTTHEAPIYIEEGVVHYCVANMPGAVPRSSTIALTNETFTYTLAIAEKGWQKAMADDPTLKCGLNVCDGHVICAPVAECFGLPYKDLGL
jgi:alanine dehydrogenase